MDSILTSVKKMLGISEEDEHFDTDIIIHINSVLMILNQLGVGPSKGFSISDAFDSWSDFIPTDSSIEAVKSYVYLRVRLLFDPPTSSAAIESINKMIAEYEWRINVMVETGEIVSNEIEELKDRVASIEERSELNTIRIKNLETNANAQNESINALKEKVNEHEELFKTLVGEENA